MFRAEATAPVIMYPIYLAGREAHCIYSHDDLTETQQRSSLMPSPQPSSLALPEFEYRGDGSIWAVAFCGTCNLGYTLHMNPDRVIETCGAFVERGPALTDAFYCQCRELDK